MEISLIEETENPLVDRKEIRFEVNHRNAPTPSRSDVLNALSSELEISEDEIVIEKVATPHGKQIASGIARVYESEDVLQRLESKHYTERTEDSKERVGEIEETEEEKEKETEEEEKAEEEAEEKTEKEKEETTEEKIDYQEISNLTISEIKEKSEELDIDYQKLLEAEEDNKDRKTLKNWIESRIEE